MKVHSLAVWGEKDAFFYIGFGEALVYQEGNYKIVPWVNHNKELGGNSFCGPFNGYPSWSGYYNIYYHNANGINGYILLPNTLQQKNYYNQGDFVASLSYANNGSTYGNTFGEVLPLSYKTTQWVLNDKYQPVVAEEQIFDMSYYKLVNNEYGLTNLEPGKYTFIKKMISGATVTPEEKIELELKVKAESLGWELDRTKRYNLWAGAYKPVEGSTETTYRLVGAREYSVKIGNTSIKVHLTNPPNGKKYNYYLTNQEKNCEVFNDGSTWILYYKVKNKKYKWVRDSSTPPWYAGESFKPTFGENEETKDFYEDIGVFKFFGMYPEITNDYVYYLEDY